MSQYQIREVEFGSAEYRQFLHLREQLLRIPLGRVLTPEDTAGEFDQTHMVAMVGGQVIAGLILRPLNPQTLRLRQMVVIPAWQRHGVGSALLQFACDWAAEHRCLCLELHARASAIAFYQRAGFVCCGQPFTEVGIAHRLMYRELPGAGQQLPGSKNHDDVPALLEVAKERRKLFRTVS